MAKVRTELPQNVSLLKSTDLRDNIFTSDLMAMTGVVIRQDTQFMEAMAQIAGLPYEARNRYKISKLPTSASVASYPTDPMRWQPTQQELIDLPMIIHVKEESDAWYRCLLTCLGCGNLRAMVLHFFEGNVADGSTPDVHERFRVERPCRVGIRNFPFIFGGIFTFVLVLLSLFIFWGNWAVVHLLRFIACVLFMIGTCVGFTAALGCKDALRLEMSVRGEDGELIGRVAESMEPYHSRVYDVICRCTFYDDVYEASPDGRGEQHVFTSRISFCCCHRRGRGHWNCCGGTCCRNDFVWDIIDPATKAVVATVQKTYAPGGCGAFCRMCQKFNNYIVKFPPQSTRRQRALVLASVFSTEYQFFEKSGGDK